MHIFNQNMSSFPHAEARYWMFRLVKISYCEVFIFNRMSSADPKMLGWNVDAADMEYIPEHWLQYEEPKASIHYLLGLLYFFFMVIALVGNGMVIWVFSW